ncbi:RHS repeat domain-containing protein [Victivallis sp. Marseille-Q1083]|uniref:RHS repeat domain-containing protein n=1 Tax=Victivallis sp. Marseille-Q1083 TaxID=2717288 RepID=UPI00158BD2F4|nr:RHS repeat-associated core domain-containing protein [Victivallis sp. Marseille-Q1083]
MSEYIQVTYAYDGMSRLSQVSASGQTAAYSRVSGANRLASTVFQAGTALVFTASRNYDHFNRLTTIGGYSYVYNDQDQRTRLTLPDSRNWNYTYDELGQVTGGEKRTAAGVAVTGQNYAYAFDTIGNRQTMTANGTATAYTANDVNQYTAIGSVTPSYDQDGNLLTGYNDWTLEWNGENRLKAIYNASTKLEFDYDYNGRRFSKKVYAKSGGNWVLSKESLFVYDNFKQIAEFTVSGGAKTLAKSYVWQPETSGDFDVPLWQKVDGNVYTCVVDGNKNVRRLLNTAGTEVANYDYDPFGGVTASGTASAGNPFRFSSEFLDEETGLVYYNYRYYSPTLGRWISRDPIGEKGGLNLYGFIRNSIPLLTDKQGLKVAEGCCGVDVTAKLVRLMQNVEKVIAIPGVFDKVCKKNNIYDPNYGWDIVEFFEAGQAINPNTFSCNKKKEGHECEKTVTYLGGCHKVFAINYLLWGVANRACKLDSQDALDAVPSYRVVSIGRTDASENESWIQGTNSRYNWAVVGIKGEYHKPPEATSKNCTPCTQKYVGTLTARLRFSATQHIFITSDTLYNRPEMHLIDTSTDYPPRERFGEK